MEKFPADVPLEGTGMDTGPRVPVLNIIREEERREGETQGLQRDTTSTLNTTHHTERVKQGIRN